MAIDLIALALARGAEVAQQRHADGTTEKLVLLTETELRAIGIDIADAVREQDAQVCREKYELRAETGYPREASTARVLMEQIRAMKGTLP